jgi:ABC-type sugar transport system ATPase subunit
VPAEAVDGSEGRIRLGVRPEKIRLFQDQEGTSGDNAVQATVKDATFVGVSNVYTVETRDGHTMTVYAQNLGTSGDRPPGPGESVTLAWHPEHTFVVSAQEGEAHG